MASQTDFSRVFPSLAPGREYPFVHKGEWAIHELLPFLLEHTGAAQVRLASFTVSEDSLRRLFFLSEAGKIRELMMLMDHTVRRHKMDMLMFASGITPQVRITSNHAKILLLSNDSWKISLVGSANLNTNARWESGILSCREDHYDAFLRGFCAAWEDATPIFDDDTHTRPDTADGAICGLSAAPLRHSHTH